MLAKSEAAASLARLPAKNFKPTAHPVAAAAGCDKAEGLWRC
ncbi:hypothetical protein C4K25_0222 [Pseudomonas chlororaphis]|nr:hypothetical protein C4K25_0222 [Pseudomonas chlororaphis]